MNWFSKSQRSIPDYAASILYDEGTFYNQFTHDLTIAKEEIIIESPYITLRKARLLYPFFQQAIRRGVRITIITKFPEEHDRMTEKQVRSIVKDLKQIGITVIYYGRHHRKIAMIDRKIVWEGSLNILSYSYSAEVMRRIENEQVALEMFAFLKYNTLIF